MLVTCDKCRKKYEINVEGISTKKARFSCSNCKHLISFNVPKFDDAKLNQLAEDIKEIQNDVPLGDETHQVENKAKDDEGAKLGIIDEKEPAKKNTEPVPSSAPVPGKLGKPKSKGIRIGTYLFFTFLLIVLSLGGLLGYFYMKYVPKLLNEQVNLRTSAISLSLSSAIQEPLLIHNYLRVNKTADSISKLPGVAYVSVINKRGVPVSGLFGHPDRFTREFAATLKHKGFPSDLVSQNTIIGAQKTQSKDITVDGRPIHDVAVALQETGGEVHVGLFTEDIQKAIRKTLYPLAITLLALTFLGLIGFLILAKAISKPIRELTSTANKISIGELDIAIHPKGPQEVRTLAYSLERMRISIKAAMDRLRKVS